jgi:polyisoprenoid-binding protein YceI
MKNVILSAFVILSFGLNLSASEKSKCTLTPSSTLEVSWTGYKTPAKVGVGGTFNKISYAPVAKSGSDFKSILVGSTVVIDTTSVNSKHEGRDATLAEFFFGLLNNKNIEAKIVDIQSETVLSVQIEMNGVKNTVLMTYSFNNGVFEANGSIDLLDYRASEALAGINKACYDLHEGKTWSDVGISFQTKIDSTRCKAKN